ncbi:flavin monoamine oxidase family protein [Aeromicrobium sp. Sec7.5]|uniref:flavin monoamine oxidase family protein n=1 Tax=Aeromicrobium sp. Sec7.5 TaxID=3121276 RepID=UPI002FE4538A
MAEQVDVVVVGAGASGLAAAADLTARGRSVAVLEARDRIGGKIWTVPLAGHPVDLGAHWIGPGQDRMYALAGRLGLTVEPQRLKGRAVALTSRGRRTTRSSQIPPVPLRANLEMLRLGIRLERAARRLDRDQPWVGDDLAESDVNTLASRPLRHRDTRGLLSIMTRTVAGAEPAEMSELGVMALRRGSTSLARLVSFKGGAQQDHLVEGMGAVVDGLAEPVRHLVRTGHPVESVDQRGEQVVVTAGGEEVTCRAVVVATAPRQRRDIRWFPELPLDHRHLTGTGLGAYSKFVIAFDRPFWRDRGLSGLVLGLDHTVQMVVDLGADDVGLLAAFVTGQPARDLARLDEPARHAAVAADLVAALGPAAAEEHWRGVVSHQWREDPWSRGAPVTVFGPGAYLAGAPALARPHGRVHWAGTDSANRWSGYVEGALQAGERAAAEVDALLG